MVDIQRLINASVTDKYSHLECAKCGKRSVVGNVAQRIREGWPLHCGTRLVPVRKGEKIVRREDGKFEMVPQ